MIIYQLKFSQNGFILFIDMEKTLINMPSFNEKTQWVSTRIDIPDTRNYFFFTIYKITDDSMAYKIEFYREGQDTITIEGLKLTACYCLIPPAYKNIISHNIQCTTKTKQDPTGAYNLNYEAEFYLYRYQDLVDELKR